MSVFFFQVILKTSHIKPTLPGTIRRLSCTRMLATQLASIFALSGLVFKIVHASIAQVIPFPTW